MAEETFVSAEPLEKVGGGVFFRTVAKVPLRHTIYDNVLYHIYKAGQMGQDYDCHPKPEFRPWGHRTIYGMASRPAPQPPPKPPTFFGVAYTSRLYREIEAAQSLVKLRETIGPTPDLRNRDHACALLEWLNKWGCRITKKAFFAISDSLAEWFDEREFAGGELHKLQDHELKALTDAYEALLTIREFGPTAASKALFVLCPDAAIPWDAAIQRKFKLLGNAPEQYRKMLVHSGREAAALIADAARCGISDHRAIPSAVNSQAITLPELLDEYHWVTITRRHTIPSGEELRQWAGWACRE